MDMRALLSNAGAAWSRTILASLACWVTSLALAQSADLPNRHDVLEGITAAGQPSAAALDAVAKAGYKSVIDLRALTEDRGFDEKATVEGLGMSYVSLPVDGAGGVSYANAGELDKLLAELPKPILLHCASSNRVGALLALRAKADGADDAAALELGVANGLGSLKRAVEQKLSAGHD
jgi:protein tyrosine phosphatase (PTP) superfamily phosphohydrolase (DUF442 family)